MWHKKVRPWEMCSGLTQRLLARVNKGKKGVGEGRNRGILFRGESRPAPEVNVWSSVLKKEREKKR